MNAMTFIRFCPNCESERTITEMFCEGTVDSQRCNWNLLDVTMRPFGWRPTPVVSAERLSGPLDPLATPSTTTELLTTNRSTTASAHERATPTPPECTNGHAMELGDLMCSTCGADASPAASTIAASSQDQLSTVIAGWRVVRPISSTISLSDRYLVDEIASGRRGVMTLYHHGAEPDPTVYESLKQVAHEHTPTIYMTGRWDDRAFEVAEEIAGGTLADLSISIDDPALFRNMLFQLGTALDALAEVGIRHRDLRPGTLLVRQREPLDIVINGFGSARLSEFDLDIESPLEITRYMAPEAVAGGVSAASDWWSLGIVLLEQLTGGACFNEINERAFLIHVLANGVHLPENLPTDVELLLRGLLARDRLQRWKWTEVKSWLDGNAPYAPPSQSQAQSHLRNGPRITLADQPFFNPQAYALAAADQSNWQEAIEQLNRGVIATWVQDGNFAPTLLSSIRRVTKIETIDDDSRLLLALKLLNPEMPLVYRGDIVTPKWLLDHPLEGYTLVTGALPDLIAELDTDNWLLRLKSRATNVRTRATNLEIKLDEDTLQINLLGTSRARLAAEWDERRKYFPDSDHPGLLSLLERRLVSEEDLIVISSAAQSQFRSSQGVLNDAKLVAKRVGVQQYDETVAKQAVQWPRHEVLSAVAQRIEGFAKCGFNMPDDWADRFRIEKRISLTNALVLLAIPKELWLEPQKQQYIAEILNFFGKKLASSVLRGPLVKMTIGKSTARVDLFELQTERIEANALLQRLIQRNESEIAIEPSVFTRANTTGFRLQYLQRDNQLYKRDTGINGLYIGYPFVITKQVAADATTRIAPLLLWPIRLHNPIGNRDRAILSFDMDREEVRLNPALDIVLGVDDLKAWRVAADEVLSRTTLRVEDVIDCFSHLATVRSRALVPLPSPSITIAAASIALECSAVLFNVTFSGQAIGEDLRILKERSPSGTGLESVLRLASANNVEPTLVASSASTRSISNTELQAQVSREVDQYLTVDSDPSQEAVVKLAREAPGLLIEGPPGTGKSQTIVNMVCDAIGNQQTLLIVCQKYAALEVVHKRLIAEGLASRMVMVNDTNRDRIPIIKAVREQLESLNLRPSNRLAEIRQQRESTAARIEALEIAIDRQHNALHALNETIGISYRRLLSDLIGLETPTAPVDITPLRALLSPKNLVTLARLEEEVAPLVRYWLPAKFEGSALAALQPFQADPATVATFTDAFNQFAINEVGRHTVFATRRSSFEVDDPIPYKTWLDVHGLKLLDLTDSQRLALARWIPLFRSNDGSAERLTMELVKLKENLSACASHQFDPILSPALAHLENSFVYQLQRAASEALVESSFLSQLNPFKLLRKRRLTQFLIDLSITPTKQNFANVVASANLEITWRPLRSRLAATHRMLQLKPIEKDDGSSLLSSCSNTLGQFTDVSHLVERINQFAGSSQIDNAIRQESKEAIVRLFSEFDSAFARSSVRSKSALTLQGLEGWMNPEWLTLIAHAIQTNIGTDQHIKPITAALPSVSAYQYYRARSQHLSPLAISFLGILRQKSEVLEQCLPTELDTLARRIINREARLGWKHTLEQSVPELVFERTEIEAKIAALEKLDGEMRQLNRQVLELDIETDQISSILSWEDITRLRGQRTRRLREFVELGTPLGLMALRPIWLMNPDTASRLLPLKAGLFDKVIYDEASQMPVEFALPTLFRAKLMIVSGDEKQMPPTAFFSNKIESDEAQIFDGEVPDEDAVEAERNGFEEDWNRREIKDCPDLLQLARTCLPNARLKIHYRSAYRELINYSNAAFYGHDLSVPVRHSDSHVERVKPIELIHVNGIYQDQTNPDEANKVIDLLTQLWAAPYEQRPSVGVVTFNRKQADLIKQIIDNHAESNEVFREAYRVESERNEQGEDMSIFIKNVENVQGDERDIIIFSSTFGLNRQNTFRRNFGVLGQTGGERRLNVAVTRSRKKIIMLTSMPISAISDMLTTRRPPSSPRDFLQGYMEYARAISVGEFDSARALLTRFTQSNDTVVDTNSKRGDDGFTEAVGTFLRLNNFQIKASGNEDVFGLDYAVENPSTGLFIIGIECDAPRHSLLAYARGREVWRTKVLRRSIPVIHRVSSTDWYRNRAQEQERLLLAIQQALHKKESV